MTSQITPARYKRFDWKHGGEQRLIEELNGKISLRMRSFSQHVRSEVGAS